MRIMVLSPYVYGSRFAEHRKNKTGFGLMVSDIADSLAEHGNEVYIITHAFGPKRDTGRRHICRRRFFDVLLHMSFRGLVKDFSRIAGLPDSARMKMRYAFYRLDRGFILDRIKRIKPDIVHIHGIGKGTENYVEACRELSVPYIVTAHGLLAGDPGASETDKALELDFFRKSEHEGIPVTVVSSGIKLRLTGKGYGLKNARNVFVVPNGTRIEARARTEDLRARTEDLRARTGALPGEKICVSAGSVCRRKNQIQTVRAFALLPEKIRESARLIIIGTVAEGYPIREEIQRLGLSDRIKLTGFVEKKELKKYMAAADLNILASTDEGFGLSVIEGFVSGVPCVTFSDLDAVPDMFDECAMALCGERTDRAFSNAIRSALERDWDREAIRRYSRYFSLDAMAEKYLGIYSKVISGFNLLSAEGSYG